MSTLLKPPVFNNAGDTKKISLDGVVTSSEIDSQEDLTYFVGTDARNGKIVGCFCKTLEEAKKVNTKVGLGVLIHGYDNITAVKMYKIKNKALNNILLYANSKLTNIEYNKKYELKDFQNQSSLNADDYILMSTVCNDNDMYYQLVKIYHKNPTEYDKTGIGKDNVIHIVFTRTNYYDRSTALTVLNDNIMESINNNIKEYHQELVDDGEI